MKVLWLCNITIPKIAEKIQKTMPIGGGWLVGLSEDLLKIKDIELTICSPIINEENIIDGHIDNLSFYCFPQGKINPTVYDLDVEIYLEDIVKKVKPDIIHIFGTEYPHTLAMINVCEKLGIQDNVVINIQGLISVIEKHYYAGLPSRIINRYTIRDLLKNDNIKKQREKFKKRGIFEIQAIQKVKHVIGRTDWDRACVKQINPNVKYHFCNETLRDEFYKNTWNINNCEEYSIFVSQCSYPVKGFHYVIEAMKIIVDKYPNTKIYTTGKSPLEVNSFRDKIKIDSYHKYIVELIKKYNIEKHINFVGDLDEKQMCNRFLKSNVFLSASSIENSPNSVGEAMILGVPTVSSDVGGVKNMLIHNEDGYLYPYDEPYMIAEYVCKIFENRELALGFSEKSKEHARYTHSRDKNLKELIEIYLKILG